MKRQHLYIIFSLLLLQGFVKNNTMYSSIKKNTISGITITDSLPKISNIGYDAPASYAGYKLVWSDEFNGSSLDTLNWSYQNGDGCPNNCGWGNNELEYYTSNRSNLFFQDGKMIIQAKKESANGKEYSSAKIISRGKKYFKFGRIDLRAKAPKGKGIWPAFWMMPEKDIYGGWPKSGEVDIMEMIGHEANKNHGTLHFGPGPGSVQLGGNYTLPSGIFNDEFHVFSLEWKKDEMRWFVDGKLFSTHTISEFGSNHYPFNEDFYLIINLAVGGNWPGNPDNTTDMPQSLIVDYVRVYQ
ncbi:MAG: glycoside hydrolase family 16 protein [Ferruginibacter sp.]